MGTCSLFSGVSGRPWWRQPHDYESGGQEFESLRARQQLFDFDSESLRNFFGLDSVNVWGSTGATPCKILAANYAPATASA
jgi:hypothetical protein